MRYFLTVILVTYISVLSAQTLRSFTPEEESKLSKLEEMATIFLNEKSTDQAANAYYQIAFIYWKTGRAKEAVEYFKLSAELFLQNNHFEETKNIYSNIGVIYTDIEELDKALEFFEKSLIIRRKSNKKVDIASGLIDVAFILQALRFNDDAISRLNESLDIATSLKNQRLISDCYQLLSKNYQELGNNKKSKEYWDKYLSYQSFIQEENIKEEFTTEVIETQQQVARTEEEKRLAQQLFELKQQLYKRTEDSLSLSLRAKQDSLFFAEETSRRRQLQIENLNKERQLQDLALKEQEAQQQKQQAIITAVAGVLILMIILAVVMFRANRSRRKANMKLEKQNREIAEKSEQLGNALKKIAHQNQNITQSINYAKGIQRALLPKADKLNQFINDSFILFKPRDIVSGDFYYFKYIDSKSDIFKIFSSNRRQDDNTAADNNNPQKTIISAVDCTGHGVPGAFMSMIGFNLLDEITNKGITRPDLILEEMHRGVRTTLKQKETNNQDGMDMTICVIDPTTKTLEFAGAKNPLLYIQNNEIQQIKGDKNGIGGKNDDQKFTLHTIKIDKPTWFYIFSDGYIDQFGGDNGRKFMIKTFREMLLQNHHKSPVEQREILYKTMVEWMGTNYNQIDDILVIGFKLDFNQN